MDSFSDRVIASARTSDHQPMPTHPTRTGSNAIFSRPKAIRRLLVVDAPTCADRFDRLARDALVELESAAADSDTADAFAIDDDRAASFHRGPSIRPRREREADDVIRIESLRLGASGAGRAFVRSSANGLGCRRVHRVEASAFHALEQDEMAARVRDRD